MNLLPLLLNVPVFTLLLIIVYTGYAYCATHITRLLQTDLPDSTLKISAWRDRGVLHLAIFSVLTTIFAYCLLCSYMMSPGSVPDDEMWKIGASDSVGQPITASALMPRELGGPDLKERKLNGELRTCKWCKKLKADRCHHCSRCNNCVLRMDHHCPWINNCVGHRNVKFFWLTIFYGLCLTTFMTVTSVDTLLYYAQTLEGGAEEEANSDHCGIDCLRTNSWLKRIWIFSSMLCLTICLSALMLFYVTFLTANFLRNQTTLEFCEKNTKSRRLQAVDANAELLNYDLGMYRNMQQVLGPHVLTWLLPIDYGRGDGLSFPIAPSSQREEESGLISS